MSSLHGVHEFRRLTEPVTRTQIVRFAGAAGDFNPMHHDEPFALAAGHPSVFAMGQLPAAILGSAVSKWLGRGSIAAYGVRFKDKVWPGDRLVLSGRRVDERRWELEAAREADGVVVMTGWATVRATGRGELVSAYVRV
jgi:acyl dehydratase